MPGGGKPVFWTEAKIIAALQRDAARRGRAPTLFEWGRAVRGRRPAGPTVVERFGSWNAALEQAGLEPRTGHLPRTHCALGHELVDGSCATCRKASRRRYQARRRRRLLLAGRCTTCGGTRDQAGYFGCSRCRARANAALRRRRDSRLA
jgi:hypothetical protein